MTISHELKHNKTILHQYFENASKNNKKKTKIFYFPENFYRLYRFSGQFLPISSMKASFQHRTPLQTYRFSTFPPNDLCRKKIKKILKKHLKIPRPVI